MKYKLLCSDLDGTLLSTKSDVSKFTITQIARIKNQLRVILVSARMPQSMTYIQERLGIEEQPIICYNGALILEGTKEIFSQVINYSAVVEVYKQAKILDVKLGLYYNYEWYVEATSKRVEKEINNTRTQPKYQKTAETLEHWNQRNISAHKIMLMGTKESADALFSILNNTQSENMQIYRSNDTLIELAPKTVSKLSAIQLMLSPEETLDDVIAFGDNYNDVEMLQNVGLGIAVANAREQVKMIANHLTLKNTEDGVAHFIKQHLI